MVSNVDWSKAKTILIISFIIINILLTFALFQDNQKVDATLEEEFISDAIRLLNNKNIILRTEIPKENPSLTALIVEYENIKLDRLNESFFEDKGTITTKDEGLGEIKYEDEIITLVNRKLLLYESKKDTKQYNISSEEEAIKIAKEFLSSVNFDISDMELSYVKTIEDTYYIEFSKIYNGRYLESAFTNIQLNNTGIKRLERLWLNVIEEGESQIYISSAPKSILGLLSMNEVYGKTIKEISLCHYFEPEKHDYIKDPQEAKEGRAIPAWRIQFEDGYKVFIDNY